MGEDGDHRATQVTTELPSPPGAPQDPLAAGSAGPLERGRLRRRLRRLRRVRARQLVELGTLAFDARKRSNGSRPEVLERRAAEAAEIEREVRELAHAVDPHADPRELATGVAGSCRTCGTLTATEDRFCPSCGTPVKPGRAGPVDATPVQAPPAALPPPGGQFVHVDRSTIPPPPPPAGEFAHVDRSTIPAPPPPTP